MINLPGYTISETNEVTRKAILHTMAKDAHDYLTICEQLRYIYDTVYDLTDEDVKSDLTEKLIDAFAMAKKMNKRLVQYKRQYQDSTGHSGSNLVYLRHPEERTKIRSKRIV